GMTLTKSGPGTQVFSANQTYTGATTISAGTLQLGTGVTGQDGTLTSASIVDNAVLAFNNFAALTYSGNISGTGSLVKNGAGTLILSGTDIYSGPTVINAGILQYDAAAAIAAGTGRNITVNAPAAVALNYVPVGSIQADLLSRIVATSTGAIGLMGSISESFDFSSASNNFANLSLGAVGSATYNTGTLTPNGTTYRLGGGGGTLVFTPGSYSSGYDLVINGNGLTGIVDFGAASKTFGAITIAGGTVQNGTLTGTSFSLLGGTVNAVLDGPGVSLTKTGTNTLTLTGVNTYTGSTTVNRGTLVADTVNTDNVISNASPLFFTGTGTFQLKGLSGQARNQTFNGLTLTAGAATIDANNVAGGTSTTIDLRGAGGAATITRSAGTAVDFKATAGTLGNTAVIKTAQLNDGTGILGAWATVAGGTDWAINDGAGIVTNYTGYNTLSGTAPSIASSAGTNYRVSNTSSNNPVLVATGTTDVNTLRINDSTARTIDIRTSGGTQGILRFGAIGGILTSGGSHIIGVGATGGMLTAGGADNTAGELIVNCSSTLQINSIVTNNGTGALSLTKVGAGTLFLNAGGLSPNGPGNAGAKNLFTGVATLAAGTIKLPSQAQNGLGTGPFTILGGTTIDVAGNNIQTLNNSQYTLNGDFTTSGNVLNFSTGNVTLGANITVTVGNTFNVNGVISDGGNTYGLTKDGTSILNLAGTANTYSGKTVVLNGTLQFITLANVGGGNSSLGAPTTVANGTIDLYNGVTLNKSGAQTTCTTDRIFNLAGSGPGTVAIQLNNNDTWLTNNSPLTVTGTGAKKLSVSSVGDNTGIIFNGGIPDASDGSPLTLQVTIGAGGGGWYGYVSLNGTNTFSGDITVSGGSASVNGNLIIGKAGLLGSGNYAGAISLGLYSTLKYASSASQTLSGVISGTGGLLKSGAGSLTLSAANTFSGATTVSTGTLTLNNNLALQNSALATSTGAITLGGGVTAPTLGGLTGSTAMSSVVAAGGYSTVTALTLNPQSGSLIYSGVITNGAAGMTLTKSGAGTQTLTGANTYSGGTTISGGTLAVGTGGTLGSGDVTVAAAGTLSLTTTGGAIENTKRLTLANGAVVNLGASVNETVNTLYFGTAQQAKGTYGSSSSSPTPNYIDNARFTGTGVLNVQKGKDVGLVIMIL
ncbi:MAG: autotransporter-associated beta strand repeat-containing protein, partial [bacterium]